MLAYNYKEIIMKKNQSIFKGFFGLLALAIVFVTGCKKRDIVDLQNPQFPNTAEVFIDDFTGDLAYAAFGGSDVKAFQVDNQVNYGGTRQSMRFDVPDANSPNGSYAGGVFFSKTGRNLSGYNALTFYIKASQAATIGVVGFGNDLGENKYQVTLSGLPVNSNWKKVIIPIPDASKLTAEKGLMYYSTGPENGRGYTFWIDEVRFEKLSDLANLKGLIYAGQDKVINNAETGDKITINGLQASVNLPSGVNQTVDISPYYFTFNSSTPAVANVDAKGLVSVVDAGTATIKAVLGKDTALGSLRLTSTGIPVGPTTKSPVPTRDAADVISLYSNAYTNVPVETWNARYQFSNVDEFFIKVQGDDVIRYRNLNFVGIEFKNPTVNASGMSGFHIDIWTPDVTALPNNFKVLLTDLGANNAFGGGDDKTHEVTITSPTLSTGNWVSIDIPFSAFTGLTTRAHLGQMVLSGTLPNLYIDNVYFYKIPTRPAVAAPTPTRLAANVISIFSDAYTNIAGTDFNPNWGQATVTTQTLIAGNNTLSYAGLNYQGLQFGSNQNVSTMGFLHLDYYTVNSTSLKVYLISPGPVETPFTLTVPAPGWNSVDIPLSAFSPVALNNLIQMKWDGNGDIYVDNIYFYKNPAPPTTPTVAAPTPTTPAANVISIFSDAYTNVAGSDLNPNWGQATVVSQLPIAGNNTLKYAGLNYQGLQLGSNQNVSSYGFLHLDYYSANSTGLKIYLISPGPVETPYTLTVPTTGSWTSVNIPLSAFAPVDLSNVIQFKFDGNGDIFLDNIYFYKTSGGGGGGAFSINKTIDFELSGFGAGWTWNVFENGSNPALQFVANPNASGINTSSTVAKFTALQAGQPYAGVESAHGPAGMGITWDLSASNAKIRIMVYKTKISDVGFKLVNPAGGAQVEIKVANTKINQWEELVFDFSSRIGNGLDGSTNIDQIVVFPDFIARGADDVIYFDNIRFGN
jgi:Bacterial Ig-like domain (group 2)/Carbohydrate binding domain (family 11)